LPSEGSTLRSACGSTTAHHARRRGSDSATHASHCPCGTASMPARYTWAVYGCAVGCPVVGLRTPRAGYAPYRAVRPFGEGLP
jgi:hypothetical protein